MPHCAVYLFIKVLLVHQVSLLVETYLILHLLAMQKLFMLQIERSGPDVSTTTHCDMFCLCIIYIAR